MVKTSHVAVADTPEEIIHSCLISFALIFTEVIYTDFYYFFQLVQCLLILPSKALSAALNTTIHKFYECTHWAIFLLFKRMSCKTMSYS